MKLACALLAVAGLVLPLAKGQGINLLEVAAVTVSPATVACGGTVTFTGTLLDLLPLGGTPKSDVVFKDTNGNVLCTTPAADLTPTSGSLTTLTDAQLTDVLNALLAATPAQLGSAAGAVATLKSTLGALGITLTGESIVAAKNALTTKTAVNAALATLDPLLGKLLITATCTTSTLTAGTYTVTTITAAGLANGITGALPLATGLTLDLAKTTVTVGACPTLPPTSTPTPTPAASGCPTGITIGTSTPEIAFPACLAPTFTVTLTGVPATATPTVSIDGFGGDLVKQLLSPADLGFSIAKGLIVTASAGSGTVTATLPSTSLKHGTYSAVATVNGCPALSAKVAFEQTVACLTKVNGRRMAM